MNSPLLDLHKAMRDKIKDDYSVFDDHPEQQVFPYITMGEIIAKDWSDKFMPGMEVFATLHLWSQYPGRKEVCEMIEFTLDALTTDPLILGDGSFSIIFQQLDGIEVIIDIDGVTRHGILRLRFLIEQNYLS